MPEAPFSLPMSLHTVNWPRGDSAPPAAAGSHAARCFPSNPGWQVCDWGLETGLPSLISVQPPRVHRAPRARRATFLHTGALAHGSRLVLPTLEGETGPLRRAHLCPLGAPRLLGPVRPASCLLRRDFLPSVPGGHWAPAPEAVAQGTGTGGGEERRRPGAGGRGPGRPRAGVWEGPRSSAAEGSPLPLASHSGALPADARKQRTQRPGARPARSQELRSASARPAPEAARPPRASAEPGSGTAERAGVPRTLRAPGPRAVAGRAGLCDVRRPAASRAG